MAYEKGERIEPGIWRLKDRKGYLAEISFTDPQTGKRIRERQTSHRLDLAQQWRQTRKADALRGEIVRKKDQPKPLLFEDFGKEYLESWSKVKKRPSTYKRELSLVKQLNRSFSGKLLSEITRRDVERHLAKRKDQGRRPGTLNRELCCLKNMLRKAVDWEYLESNPAWGVKQQKEETPEFEFLRDDEITRLLDICEDSLKTLLTLAIYTGMRRGELFKLEWRDVDFNKGEKGMITVRDTKNRETRYIPRRTPAREALQRHPKRLVDGKVCPLVFSNDEGKKVYWIERAYKRNLKNAGIERHIRFHDLRHTFASHLVMRGVDIRSVAQLMGHKSILITQRYAHLAPDHLQGAVDALEKPLEKRGQKQAAEGAA